LNPCYRRESKTAGPAVLSTAREKAALKVLGQQYSTQEMEILMEEDAPEDSSLPKPLSGGFDPTALESFVKPDIPSIELLALIGRGRIWDSFPVHFLHLSVADTGFREKHPCFYSIMWPAVATTHPSSLCGAGIVQYLYTGIYVNALGRSLASVCNTDIGTQRLTWVNNNSGVRLFRLVHEVDSEPGSFVGLRSAELLIVDDHSQRGDHEHKNISKELKPFYPSRLIGLSVGITQPELARRIVGLLFLVGAAFCFLYAQIIPFWRLRRKPMVGIAIGIVLLVLGLLSVAQFYNLVLK
jgi:hypothetical protein